MLSGSLGQSLGWEDPLDGNTLQYFCLENPTDRGAWRVTIQRVTELGGLTEATWHMLGKEGTNNTGFK